MNLLKTLITLCFQQKLKKIFNNNETLVASTIESFFISFKKFNTFMKFIIINFLFLIFTLNLFFIFIYFFKFRVNFFYEVINFISRIPYLKNINNFILAHLLLHFE